MMTNRLIQKDLLKGSRSFEIVDDRIDIRIKAPFKTEEKMSVMLTVLDPEPVIGQSSLEFKSRVNGEALVSFFPGKPNAADFNAFIALLKQRAEVEYNDFAGLRPDAGQAELPGNVYEVPPEMVDSAPDGATKIRQKLSGQRIEESIQMLRMHVDEADIAEFIASLQALKAEPDDELLMSNTVKSFNDLGPLQGAVLAYAPYVITVLSDDPFNW